MIRLCVLLWPHPGQERGLADYETEVLALLGRHGATVVSRVSNPDHGDHRPAEVQLIELPDEDALTSYLNDPDRAALSGARDRAVARTEILRVSAIS